jgi:hypothetical protein
MRSAENPLPGPVEARVVVVVSGLGQARINQKKFV